jgi:hypothetical protein
MTRSSGLPAEKALRRLLRAAILGPTARVVFIESHEDSEGDQVCLNYKDTD